MLREIRPAIVVMLALTVITGLAYPLAMTGLGQVLFPHQANGSLIERDGKVVGSALIGQDFTSARYFHGRPSATTEPDPKDPTKTVPVPYAADNSGASNLAPTAKALIERVQGDVAKLRPEANGAPIPADLVTTSASGLDPHISPASALLQVHAVAAARGLADDQVRALVESHIEGRLFGIIGEARVNVLELNLALDALTTGHAGS
jgi:K+-transporting ATPase ATPase C chain